MSHRVDVEAMACDCESFIKGKAHRSIKEAGFTWSGVCPHLRLALAAHGIIRALEESINHRSHGP